MKDKLWKNRHWLFAVFCLAVLGALFKFMLTGHDYIGYLFFLAAVLVVYYHFTGRKLRIAMTALLLIGTMIFAVLEVQIVKSARTDAEGHCDYVVVLGAGLHGDVPSLSLTNRLTAALAYLEQYPEAVAVVSGGQGPGENMTEAEAMGIWLEARGVDPARILREDRATSTFENLEYSYDIIRARGDDPDGNVAIVTSEYHLHRAKLASEAMGVRAYGVAGETTILTLKINYFIREALALGFYKVFGGL